MLKIQKIGLLTLLVYFTLLTNLITNPFKQAWGLPGLNVTVTTDKKIYNVGETIQVSGNLTINGQPASNGLVAVQVNDPKNVLYIIRTCLIGSATPWKIEVLQVYLSDQVGNPKNSVARGTLGYITIIWRNNDNVSHQVSITLNLCYEDSTPFLAFVPFTGNVPAGKQQNMTVSVPIPSDAPTGTATVYASAMSTLPSNGGYPYSPEKSSNFTITKSTSSSSTNQTLGSVTTNEGYNIKFKTPNKDARLGNYTIYVTAICQEQTAQATHTFKVVLLGDVNFDGKVDMSDIGLILRAYGTKKGDPKWNPIYDLNNDEKVDMSDIGITLRNFGNTGKY